MVPDPGKRRHPDGPPIPPQDTQRDAVLCAIMVTYTSGEMAEWFNATVLKTVVGAEPTGGSNPSLSAAKPLTERLFSCLENGVDRLFRSK